MPKNFRSRRTSSSSEEETPQEGVDAPVDPKEKIEEIKFLQKQRQRTHGLDVYSLAIGDSDSSQNTIAKIIENDPWKTKTGGLVDMKLLREKRGNEIVKNMHSNFAKETNQRDEDAEMQKFIEEQLRKKREAEKSTSEIAGNNGEGTSGETKKYKTPDEALFDVPKYLIESKSKMKSEETLSDQMLSGIPEVDLGLEERIKNIEETEKAKQRLLMQQTNPTAAAAATTSGNKRKLDDKASVDRASDDHCLEKFKRNMRNARSNKIKIA